MNDALTTGIALASFALLASRAPWLSALSAIALATAACSAVAFTLETPRDASLALNLAAAATTALCVTAVLGGVQLDSMRLAVAGAICGAVGGALLGGVSAGAAFVVLLAPMAILVLSKIFIARGWTIALKVLASWLLAVTILTTASAALVRTPVADHME